MNAWSYHEFTLRTSQLRHTLFITNYCRSIKHGAWCYLWIGVGKKIDFKIRILPFKKRAYFETTFSKVDPVMAWPCWTALEGPSSLSRCRETTPRSSRSRMEHGGTARRRRTLGPISQTLMPSQTALTYNNTTTSLLYSWDEGWQKHIWRWPSQQKTSNYCHNILMQNLKFFVSFTHLEHSVESVLTQIDLWN